MNRLMTRTRSPVAADVGFTPKNACSSPANTTSSTSSFSFPRAALSRSAYSTFLSLSRSPSAATTSTRPTSNASRPGLSGPSGFTSGWSLFAPAGRKRRQYLSQVSLVRNAVAGESSSDCVGCSEQNAGMSRMYPSILIGSSPALPNRRARWCAMLPPADSPETNTLRGSAASASHGSEASWFCSQRRAAAASSWAAGRRCSGARR
uniref:Uncharacterized protein n=1 Tax=Triticum urartu TaxID=4572 RepID=A0A8R7R388_TRIUA